jgi:hypothetical protein
MKKDDLCRLAISLENEIEFLKETEKPTKAKKIQLNKIYRELKQLSERKITTDENLKETNGL